MDALGSRGPDFVPSPPRSGGTLSAMPVPAKSARNPPAPEKHKVTCPVCRKKVPLGPEARCEACSSLLFSPVPGAEAGRPLPPLLRTLQALVTSQAPARFLAARAPGAGALLVPAFFLMSAALGLLAWGPELVFAHALDWPKGLVGDVVATLFACVVAPVVGLGLVANLALNAAVLIKRAGLPALEDGGAGLLPVVDARFSLMGFRGRRAVVVYVTFRVELCEPTTRVGLFVRLETEEGKPLGARLPRYRAPDGEFLLRELGAPVGRPGDGLFTMGALIPLSAVVLPGAAGHELRLVGRIELRVDERVETTQRLVTTLETVASDYPVAPRPRAEPGAASAESDSVSMEIVAVALSTAADCPVCGEGLAGPVQRCTGCDTPHHPECWAFAGRCSTYACEGSPRMAERVDPGA